MMEPTSMTTKRKFKEPVVLIPLPERFDAAVFRAVAARRAASLGGTLAPPAGPDQSTHGCDWVMAAGRDVG